MHSSLWRRALCCALIAVIGVATTRVSRADPTPQEPADCRTAYPYDEHLRVQCYDAFFKPSDAAHGNAPVSCPEDGQSHILCKEWDIGHTREEPAFGLETYLPNYGLIASWTDNRNIQPSSKTRGPVPITGATRDATEIKFQFSLKSLLWSNRESDAMTNVVPGFDKFRLWLAFTQQSNWQAYNFGHSAPFRESNYQPEVIASFGRDTNPSSFLPPLKLLNFGAVHQSNGQTDPQSRSWNRLFVQAGFDFDNLMLLTRLWYRIPEQGLSDDNPRIQNYVGRADLTLRGYFDDGFLKGTMVTLLHRNNLEIRSNRSFTQLDLSPCWFGFARSLNKQGVRLHLQATTGFGESLIDYNHHQTTVGLGLSFGDDTNAYDAGRCDP